MKLLLVALMLAAAPALAEEPIEGDPCASWGYGLASGPAVTALEEGALGRAQRACGRHEVALNGSMYMSIHAEEFYADIVAMGQLEGSVALGKRGEVFAIFEFLRYDLVFSAIESDHLGIGHTTLGGTGRFLVGKGYTLGVTGKVVLPTATDLYRNTRPLSFDVGVTGQFVLHPVVHLHAHAAFLGGFGIGKGPDAPRAGATMTVGPQFRLHPTVALGVDVHAQFGYWAPVDVFALAPAIRFSDGARFGFELSGIVPIAGRERAQMAMWLRFSVRLGDIDKPARPWDKADEKMLQQQEQMKQKREEKRKAKADAKEAAASTDGS
jgi:hypothetical protein